MKILKWGLIGYGEAAKKLFIDLSVRKNSIIECIASKSQYDFLSKKYPDINIFNSYENLIKKNNLDIIYLSLINSLHYKFIKKIIQSNQNILIEKPACIEFSQLADIRDQLNKKQNLYFRESILYLSHPIIMNIFEIIKNENIGNIVEIESNFGFNFKKKKFLFFLKKNNKKLFSKMLGGGSILNFGHYPLSAYKIFCEKFNKIKNIKKNIKIGYRGVDEDSKLEIDFEKRAKLKTEVSLTRNLKSFLRIKGEYGNIFIENPWIPSTNYEILLEINGVKKIFKYHEKKSLWQLKIDCIEKDFNEGLKKPSTIGTDIESSFEYMKLINIWKNSN